MSDLGVIPYHGDGTEKQRGDAVAWLREQVQVRLAAAKAADPAPWEQQGHEYVLNAMGHVAASVQFGYDSGRHIVLNDPQDAIARCEAELAILDEHRLVAARVSATWAGSTYTASWEVAHDPPSPEDLARLVPGIIEAHCRRCRCPFPCWDILNLRTAYRHRPGYAEHWGATP